MFKQFLYRFLSVLTTIVSVTHSFQPAKLGCDRIQRECWCSPALLVPPPPPSRRWLLWSTKKSDHDDTTDTSAPDAATTTTTTTGSAPSTSLSPVSSSALDGKRILPYKIVMTGLKGYSKVAAVYAVHGANYQRGTDGWDTTTFVGVTQDLEVTLRSLHDHDTTEMKVAHCRALSFSYPQPNAMQEIASQWRTLAIRADAPLETDWANDVLNYLFDTEDGDDDDDDDDYDAMSEAMATVSSEKTIISPFAASSSDEKIMTNNGNDDATESPLPFNAANVDMVLNEVRPYLIADGGNVSVERVDEINQCVYLKLEGACGSCASSTVTMQMGIERVLREKFPTIRDVFRTEDDTESQPKELSYQAVEDEINRLKPAIMAMGGTIQLLKVDGENGIVDIQFHGSKKVQQGIELAILDVSFVQEVNFFDTDE
jgi:Fe-S cluster biogenesis protein NfuA